MAARAGLILDDWQGWCLDQALSETNAGLWSAFEVAVIVGRQNGKGSILEARQLAGLFLFHERLQVHTAHEFKTCFEHFLRVCALIESTPELDRLVARIRRGAGEQAIELKTGERLRFLARSSGSGRGLSGDTVYLDEAFALTPQMMGALLPTLSARRNPQVWYMSSAPMATSAVLHQVLQRGVEGSSERLFLANWSNPPDVDIEDTDAMYASNPALGIRVRLDVLLAELDAMRLMPQEFLRERLGVPEPQIGPEFRPPKLDPDKWSASRIARSRAPKADPTTIVYDVDMDGQSASIAVGIGTITNPYVEVVEHHPGVGWLPDRMVELVNDWHPAAIGCNGAGPAGAQVGAVQMALRDAGLTDEIEQLDGRRYQQACGGFFTDVDQGRLRRPNGQQPLDLAGEDAAERPLGDAWVWDRRQATVPISPLVAVTIARALLPTEAEAQKPVFFH